jgi:hypothetical protein
MRSVSAALPDPPGDEPLERVGIRTAGESRFVSAGYLA